MEQADDGTSQEEAPAATGGLTWDMGCYAVEDTDEMPSLVDSSSDGELSQTQVYEGWSQDESEEESDGGWGPIIRDRIAPGTWEIHREGKQGKPAGSEVREGWEVPRRHKRKRMPKVSPKG